LARAMIAGLVRASSSNAGVNSTVASSGRAARAGIVGTFKEN
jgi:hypothetical protein